MKREDGCSQNRSNLPPIQELSAQIPKKLLKKYLLGIIWECMQKAWQADHYAFGRFENEFNYFRDTPEDKCFPIPKPMFERYINYLNVPLQIKQGTFL